MAAGALRDLLLKAAEPRRLEVKINDDSFFVQEMFAVDFAEYADLMSSGDRSAAITFLLLKTVVDETGAKILSPEDAAKVSESQRVAIPLIEAAMKASGFSEKQTDAS